MVVGWNEKVPARVVVDLNTQADFLLQTGACPVMNAAELVSAVRHVVAWTKWHGVPVVSSLNTHRLGEIDHDGQATYCIDGTPGQRKLVFTMMGTFIRVEGDNTLSVPMDLFNSFQQVIFRQRTRDLFANPKADRFLTQVPAHQFLIYGVAIETTDKADGGDAHNPLVFRGKRDPARHGATGCVNSGDRGRTGDLGFMNPTL